MVTTRSVASAAFDRFAFESVAVQDGVTVELGIDLAGSGLIASCTTIDIDASSWLALQSHAGDDLLELGDEADDDHGDQLAAELDTEFFAAFAIDTDDVDALRSMLGPSTQQRLLELERSAGPLVIIIDPGERLDDTTSLIVARALPDRSGGHAAGDIDVAAALDLSAGVAAALS